MATPKSRWEMLGEHIREEREKYPDAGMVKNRLAAILRAIANAGCCARTVQGRLQLTKAREGAIIVGLQSGDAWDNRKRPAIRLTNLHHLEDGAVLWLKVTVGGRAKKGVRAYTVQLQGRAKASNRAWYARIDLTEEPEGVGLCAHPLLHCHVGGSLDDEDAQAEDAHNSSAPEQATTAGTDPRPRRELAPRVPMPWLSPWEAIEWLLATVDPRLEPSVQQAGSRG